MIRDLFVVLAAFVPLRFAFFPPAGLRSPLQLPEPAYRDGILLLGAFRSPAGWLVLLVAVVPIAVWWLSRQSETLRETLGWSGVNPAGARALAIAAATPLVWKLTTYDVNLWLGQSHTFDRLVLAALWIGLFVSPAFIPLLVGQSAVIAFQFHYPDGLYYTWADKSLAINLLLLVASVFIVGRFVRLSSAALPLLALTGLAASYVYPAFAKMAAGPAPWSWALDNPVHQLVSGAILNGWLPGVDGVTLAGGLAPFDRLVTMGTVAVELGMLAILLSRKVSLALMGAAISMHLGVFALSGILFWEWMIPEAALVVLVAGPWGKDASLFHRRSLLLSIPLMLGAYFWLHPHLLGWMDTGYVTTYDLVATTEAGRTLEISRDAMDPYHLPFAQNRFVYARRDADIPTGTYGAVGGDGDLYRELRAARSLEELEGVRRRRARASFDPERSAALSRFLARFAHEMNVRDGDNELLPWWIEAPHHIYSPRGTGWPSGDPVRRLALTARTTWFDGERLHAIGERVVLDVGIPD